MKLGVARGLVGLALVLAPLLGLVGLRRSAHEVYASSVRMGNPTRPVAAIMGARLDASEITLQEMEEIDQYWFAFDGRDAATLRRIASEMASGEHRLGARSVACMSARKRVDLAHARTDEVLVCVARGESVDDMDVERCTDEDWEAQDGRLVLLSVVGQDARLESASLIESCKAKAQHWHEWHQRR